MKKLMAAVIVSTLTIITAHAGFGGGPGPATFKLDALTQTTPIQQVGSKTNQTATSTNITIMFKSTMAKTAFDSSDMLAVLTNSFNTNFPADAQVGIRIGQIVVVDKTGTNIIFIPGGNVISFQFDEDFTSSMVTEISTLNKSGESESGSGNTTFIASATLTYDDSLQTTGDGTHTKFAFKGLFTLKSTENLKNQTGKTSIEFQGTGGGPVRGVPTILTGTITSKASSPSDF
jgi:hypothetical protein